MKSRKNISKRKPKSHPTSYSANDSSGGSSSSSRQSSCGSVELIKAPWSATVANEPSAKLREPNPTRATKKLVDCTVGDANRSAAAMTNLAEPTYSSFVSGISDCSSCDQQKQQKQQQQQQTKTMNLKSVEEDCEKVLEQLTNAFAQIAQTPTKTNDANQIGVQCLEYVYVILSNIEWLERERNQTADQRAELDRNLAQMQAENSRLSGEIFPVQQINSTLKRDNRELLADLYDQQERLRVVEENSNGFRSAVENEKQTFKAELEKLADSSVRVETAVKEKEIRWDNLNYHLQKRVAELQRDHDQLKANYDLMSNALRMVGNSGDVHNEPMDVGVLEAGHEAEMVMMKHAHESFISDLNKLNCKLWNEKFYKRGRLEEETKKNDLYESWLVALQQQNCKYRDEISNLDKQVEDLLDVICSKLENKCCRADGLTGVNICYDISST